MLKISLTPKENSLFKFLMDTVLANNLNLTLWVAGGWVWDKLLLKTTSTDIDIALDNMMGE